MLESLFHSIIFSKIQNDENVVENLQFVYFFKTVKNRLSTKYKLNKKKVD
jgi:hypothetical protein